MTMQLTDGIPSESYKSPKDERPSEVIKKNLKLDVYASMDNLMPGTVRRGIVSERHPNAVVSPSNSATMEK